VYGQNIVWECNQAEIAKVYIKWFVDQLVLCSSIQEEREERHKYKGAVKSVLDDGASAVKTCKFNF
jgi:hypothetical protein